MTRVIALLLLTGVLAPQTAAAAERAEPGAALYAEYCAKCHGRDGRGEGELVEFREEGLPSLRGLSTRNGGDFPLEDVIGVIDGRADLEAHGGRFMPAWGEIFRFDEEGGDALAHARILNLVLYLRKIQDE